MWTNNILIVTLGNFVGGFLIVGGLYWYVYMKPQKTTNDELAFQLINKEKIIELNSHKKNKKTKH
jgi:hypothetical protein